jgi:uncharacterized membrane protein YgaE (UPF0421/DUF939 family)
VSTARRVARARARLREGTLRLRVSALPVAQCAVAAGLAWLVANDVVGHQRPFFAPIAAVISLGVSLGSRLRRVVELVLGVGLGVLVGDLLIAQIGSGPWQIMLVVALAMGVAVFADGAALLVAQAGSSAVLVATLLPPGEVGGIDRCIDALIGGALGVLVAAVLPSDPVNPVRRQARRLLDELAAVLDATADALREKDVEAALIALRRARASQPLIDDLRAALRGGQEVTRVAPLHRRRRRVLRRYQELAERADYAMRNARVLARRTFTALSDDEPAPPELADLVAELAGAVRALTEQLDREGDRELAREPILDVVRHQAAVHEEALRRATVGEREPAGASTPAESAPGLAANPVGWPPGPSEQVIVAQLRSIALDLLQATGMSRAEALSAMRAPRPS